MDKILKDLKEQIYLKLIKINTNQSEINRVKKLDRV